MLRAFKSPLGIMPPAASRIYFKFYSCSNCKDEERYWVKPVYAPFSNDESVSMPLIVLPDVQEKDGLMPTKAFEDFLHDTLNNGAK